MKALVATLMLLTTLPAFAQRVDSEIENRRKSAPVAADQMLGMALMSVIVSANGTLVQGSGSTAVTRINPGQYLVTFERSVRGCAISANVSRAIAPGGYFYGSANAQYDGSGPTVVYVLTYNTAGVNVDNDFHLLVFCHK